MKVFRTTLATLKSALSIDYQSQILCIGSCFSGNIGQLLNQYKFPTLLNPFGILYNPMSIQKSLSVLLSDRLYEEENLCFQADLWHSFDHHGLFSHPQKAKALKHINTQLIEARDFLSKTNRLFLTFGTANIFIKKSSKAIVANCHKFPNSQFEKRRLSVEEIMQAFVPLLKKIKEKFPQIEVIFTVSPVRHLKDGLIENQRSKATLLLAIDQLTKQFAFTHYFPAYELMLDDLRAYRFFDKDMVHPNELAIQYIWQYFQKIYFTDATISIVQQVDKIVKASQHRPFHPSTNKHQQFIGKQLKKIEVLQQQFPLVSLSLEKAIFEKQLID